MAETFGSLVDKIIISELKIYHTAEQLERKDTDDAHRQLCRQRLTILQEQRDDLKNELSSLYDHYLRGKAQVKVYRQFKMYNDPRFMPGIKAAKG